MNRAGRGARVLLLMGLVGGVAAADDDPVVVRVGSASLRTSEVERRLAKVPPFQLQALAATPAEARQRFVDSVLVPELLYAQLGRERGLDRAPWVRSRLREVYHRVLRDRVQAETLETAPIGDAAVRAYYEAHASEFQSGERLLLWRILVPDKSTARRILAEVRGAGGPERWKALAREHSRDVATQLRGGALGFVAADGATDVPQVRVDPGLYAAARRVKDGELVPEPVQEGEHYAVIWRRGTRPAIGQSLEEARGLILDVLQRERAAQAWTELVSTLRKRHVSEQHPELLALLPRETPEDLQPRRALKHALPVRSATPRQSADPTPRSAGSVLR